MAFEIVERVLLFSGKRKSGKDYITEKLLDRIGQERAEIIRISEPIKSAWAKELNLDLKELLSDGPYKETYRKQMIDWSEKKRAEDFGVFCREACKKITKPTVIVSDIRRKTDMRWFQETFGSKIKSIRIKCDDDVRVQRGWKFEQGVDDVESECDLDDWLGNHLIVNNDGSQDSKDIVDEIVIKFVQN